MLTSEENELLCRVGRGTPMGSMLRRYWIPAERSSELPAGGAPRRLRLLGEQLVIFRDRSGRVGLLDEACPHRGASLTLARNEDCGLRCLYHGWVIDATGTIVETPSEPEDSTFHRRLDPLAYPTYERGGLVWAYLGPKGQEPPPLDFSWTALPDEQRWIGKIRVECNWVQCVEGVIDSAHVTHLHREFFRPAANLTTSVLQAGMIERPSVDRRPRIETQNTTYGFRYAAIRKPLVDSQTTEYVRVTLFVAPFFILMPPPAGLIVSQIFVPIDDEHVMFYYVKASREPVADVAAFREEQDVRSGMRPGIDMDHEYRKFRSRDNGWQQDRGAVERGESASGICGIAMQDLCTVESMGPIYDRTKEHLGASDAAVIRMRRMMIDAARRHAAHGDAPLGLAELVDYARLEAEERLVPHGTQWQTVGAHAGEPLEVTA